MDDKSENGIDTEAVEDSISDCILLCEDKIFRCQKKVLSKGSLYFRTMFSCNMQESCSGKIVLQEIDANALQIILEFLNTGTTAELKNDINELQSLMVASHLLEVTEMYTNSCQRLIKLLDEENVADMWNLAKLYNNSMMLKSIIEFFAVHFNVMKESLLELNYNEITHLLTCPKLTVTSYNVFQFVLQWVKADISERQNLLSSLIMLISFSSMSDDYLKFVLRNEIIVKHCVEAKKSLLAAFTRDHLKIFLMYESQFKYYSCKHRIWSATKDFPFILERGQRVVHIAEYLYVFGRCQFKKGLATAFKYNIRDDSIVKLANMKTTVSDASIAVLNGDIYLFGGFNTWGKPSNSLQRFLPKYNKWELLPTMSRGRCNSEIISGKNCLYIASKGTDFLFECFDPTSNKWEVLKSPEPMVKRGKEFVVSCLGDIYLIRDTEEGDGDGGTDYEQTLAGVNDQQIFLSQSDSRTVYGRTKKDILKYNNDQNTWEKKPLNGGPKRILFLWKGPNSFNCFIPYIYILGDDKWMYQFDPQKDEWEKLSGRHDNRRIWKSFQFWTMGV